METSECHSSAHIMRVSVKNASSFFAHVPLTSSKFTLVMFFDNHFPKDSSELVGPGYNHRT